MGNFVDKQFKKEWIEKQMRFLSSENYVEPKEFVLEDLKVTDQQKADWSESKKLLNKEQLEVIPDVIDGNKLSDWQKTNLAMGDGVYFLISEDEMDSKVWLTKENKISLFYPSGETWNIKTSDVDFLKENAQKVSPKPWESNGMEQQAAKGISR